MDLSIDGVIAVESKIPNAALVDFNTEVNKQVKRISNEHHYVTDIKYVTIPDYASSAYTIIAFIHYT